MALEPEVALTTDEQKVSYGFGLQFGDQLRKNHFDGMDLQAVIAGITHWFEHQQSAMSNEDLNPSYQAIQAKQQAKAAEMANARAELARQFMEANAARDEVTTTASGLQYEVLEEDSGGDKPGPTHRGDPLPWYLCRRPGVRQLGAAW